jgi:hypothetical protein
MELEKRRFLFEYDRYTTLPAESCNEFACGMDIIINGLPSTETKLAGEDYAAYYEGG